MKQLTTFCIMTILVFSMMSCSNTINYIQPVDLLSIIDTSSSQTVKENSNDGWIIQHAIKENTVGKKLPTTIIINRAGEKIDLVKLIKKPTLIISSDAYCSFGLCGLLEDMPKALEEINYDSKQFEIIVLLKRTEYDKNDSSTLNKTLNELYSVYEHVYLIEDKDARLINLIGAFDRLYVNKKSVVTYSQTGLPMIKGLLINELKTNTSN